MPALRAGMGGISCARSPALPARFLGGSCLAPSPAWSLSTEMLLINGLFSDGDLHHIFCTPRRSGRRGITLIAGETRVPSVFPGSSIPWEVTKVEDQVFSPPLSPKSLSKKKMISFETLCCLLSLWGHPHWGYTSFSTTWSYVFFSLLSDKIHMFPAQTICHSQFFLHRSFLMHFSPDWFLSIIARGGGIWQKEFASLTTPKQSTGTGVLRDQRSKELSAPKQSRVEFF